MPAKCQVCDRDDKIKWCSRCHQVAYCSREHQVKDWKQHQKACKKAMEENKANELDNNLDRDMSNLSVQNGVKRNGAAEALQGPRPQSSKLWSAQNSVNMEPYVEAEVTELDSHKVDAIWSEMQRVGVCILDDFLPTDQAEILLQDIKQLYARPGEFADGEIVKQGSNLGQNRIRSDRVTWVNEQYTECKGVQFLCKQMDKFVHLCSRKGHCTILNRTKPMVSCYPANGTHYKRHVDNPSKDGRILTCLYYLNKDWNTKSDGGTLCIYPTCLNKKKMICEPKFNRVILFFSDERNPHEVLPTHRERFAITCWYFDKDEREKALSKIQQNMSQT